MSFKLQFVSNYNLLLSLNFLTKFLCSKVLFYSFKVLFCFILSYSDFYLKFHLKMAESISLINPPHIEFTSNNSGKNKDIRCLNYRFQLKSIGKLAACFRCSGFKGIKCYSTIILKTKIVRTDVANYN